MSPRLCWSTLKEAPEDQGRCVPLHQQAGQADQAVALDRHQGVGHVVHRGLVGALRLRSFLPQLLLLLEVVLLHLELSILLIQSLVLLVFLHSLHLVGLGPQLLLDLLGVGLQLPDLLHHEIFAMLSSAWSSFRSAVLASILSQFSKARAIG